MLPVLGAADTAFAAPSKFTGASKPVPPAVTVFHILSPRCEACLRWDARHLPRWLNSGEFRRSAYRRIEANTVEEALDARRWPAEARGYAGTFRQTPAFIVLRQGRSMVAADGEDAWTQVIWPAIQRAAA